MASQVPITLDTPITVKVAIEGSNRRFKVALRDLGANVFETKLRSLLNIPNSQAVVFERYSDSAGTWSPLDPTNTQAYKTLFRAAKAKLKLRLKATVDDAGTSVMDAPILEVKSPQPAIQSDGVSLGHSVDGRMAKMIGDIAISKDEAPVPDAFTVPEVPRPTIAPTQLAFRAKSEAANPPVASWSVYCNKCDKPMANEHYHCSVCDDGDYDLCESCVESGTHCYGSDHWLLKRFVQNGQVVNSTSEKIAPKAKHIAAVQEVPLPSPFVEEQKPVVAETYSRKRTCNSCIDVLPEQLFVHCKDCEDYDLCIPCHVGVKHGHHPGHTFEPATAGSTIGPLAEFLCNTGRNVRHAAVCDGCDKYIYGVRHKCLNCPDWDYCSRCIKNCKFIHPGHRFVAIYEPLPEPRAVSTRHYGVYCDGPLCKDKSPHIYIEGVRYKCAICCDTDFCANCEASPSNRHNRTHPLIKFKTPVRNVSVSTMGEDRSGAPMAVMGDRNTRRSTSTATSPVSSVNAATQVQTIVDLKPSEDPSVKKEKIQIKDLLSEPIEEVTTHKVQQPTMKVDSSSTTVIPKEVGSSELVAEFVRDTVTDGTKVLPGALFSQTWTMLNKGPNSWPAGCSVRYVGGDNMLNVDGNHPSTAAEINEATESNVINRDVHVGEEVSFRVLMKAPKREGTAISYWRLKAADGIPFGHRLWCHIDVTNSVSKPQPKSPSTDDFHGLKAQLELLEARNRSRLQMVRAAQETQAQKSDETNHSLKQSLDDALKKHAEVRAAAIANMRRAAERMDAEFQRMSPAAEETQPASKQEDVPSKAEDPEQEQKNSMIFPQLDKESPVSSTYKDFSTPQAVVAASEHARAESITSPSVKSDLDFFEDAETVDYSDSSDDGFATDEEYDILDASDQELP